MQVFQDKEEDKIIIVVTHRQFEQLQKAIKAYHQKLHSTRVYYEKKAQQASKDKNNKPKNKIYAGQLLQPLLNVQLDEISSAAQ